MRAAAFEAEAQPDCAVVAQIDDAEVATHCIPRGVIRIIRRRRRHHEVKYASVRSLAHTGEAHLLGAAIWTLAAQVALRQSRAEEGQFRYSLAGQAHWGTGRKRGRWRR